MAKKPRSTTSPELDSALATLLPKKAAPNPHRQPTTPEAAERARFEAWAKSQHYNLDRDKYGGYASIASHAAWAAWRAALAAQEGTGNV